MVNVNLISFLGVTELLAFVLFSILFLFSPTDGQQHRPETATAISIQYLL